MQQQGERAVGDANELMIAVAVSSSNRPRGLRRAVASVLAQTYPHARMHVIVVDDASSDPGVADALQGVREQLVREGFAHTVTRMPQRVFVGRVRNVMLQRAAELGVDYVCMMVWLEMCLSALLSMLVADHRTTTTRRTHPCLRCSPA